MGHLGQLTNSRIEAKDCNAQCSIGYNEMGEMEYNVSDTSRANPQGMSRAEERDCIVRAKKGDRQALRILIDSHKDRLFHFVRRVVRDHHEAEEVCQDAFLKAFNSLSTFKPEYRFSTWLYTIAYRVSLNGLRRKRPVTGDVDFSVIPDRGEEVGHQAAQSEEAAFLKRTVWSAVDGLTAPQRATVILFYREQQSCLEIAEVLRLPVATVKSHLHRARARLKEILEPALAKDSDRLRILTGLAG